MLLKKKVFYNKDFMLLWAGQLVSRIGSSMHKIAMAWYIYEFTGSTLALSISIVTSWLPQGLISPFAGVLADRYDRKKIIIAMDVISGLLVLSLFAVSLYSTLNLAVICLFNIFMSLATAFFEPAASAATQSVLSKEEYQDSNSLNQISFQSSFIVGAFLGGLLMEKIGIQSLLITNGISFLISALSECFIHIPIVKKVTKKKESIVKNFKPAIHFLITNKVYFVMVLFAGVIANGAFISLSLYMPAIFKNILYKGSTELGLYYSINGIVATLTSFYLLGTRKKFDPYKGALAALLLEALVILALGLSSNLYLMYGISAVLGIATPTCSIMVSTVRMEIVPNKMMGRIASFMGIVAAINIPFWTFLFGILGEIYRLQTIIVYVGMIFLLSLIPAGYIFAKEGKGFFAKKSSAQIPTEVQ